VLLKRAADAATQKGKRHPYEVIGVDPVASASQIRKAYLKLSLKFHPDKNGGKLEAEQAFRDIQDAYEIIGDPEKRSVFDDFGSGGNDPHQQFTNEGDWQRHGNAHQVRLHDASLAACASVCNRATFILDPRSSRLCP
jgi:DnaJ-class molecular chaperone